MRTPKWRMFSPSSSAERRAEGDDHVVALFVRLEVDRGLGVLGGVDVARLVNVGRYDGRLGALGEVGRSALELLDVAVGGATTLGVDDEIPVVFDEFNRQLGAAPIDLESIDRNGVEVQHRLDGLAVVHEEAVHGGGHHGASALLGGQGREQQDGVGVARVIRHEDEGTLSGDVLAAAYFQAREPARVRPHEVGLDDVAGEACRVSASPLGRKIQS